MAYTQIVKYAPMSLVEMLEFTEQAEKFLSEEQCYELLTHIAENPACGVVMPGTGGVRKLRWPMPGRGRRGGARVIYFYHDQDMPILLITMYPKSAKRDLSQAEKNELKKLIPILVNTYQNRRRPKK
jgi:hypothetical protein